MYITPYKDWFNTRNEHQENIYFYATNPKSMDTSGLLAADKRAKNEIEELEFLIRQVKEYRTALSKRYNEIQSMEYTLELSLQRKSSWRGDKKIYNISIDRIFSDGFRESIIKETYEGRERHKAIKRFKELQKAHPGINAIVDIEKKSWEK